MVPTPLRKSSLSLWIWIPLLSCIGWRLSNRETEGATGEMVHYHLAGPSLTVESERPDY